MRKSLFCYCGFCNRKQPSRSLFSGKYCRFITVCVGIYLPLSHFLCPRVVVRELGDGSGRQRVPSAFRAFSCFVFFSLLDDFPGEWRADDSGGRKSGADSPGSLSSPRSHSWQESPDSFISPRGRSAPPSPLSSRSLLLMCRSASALPSPSRFHPPSLPPSVAPCVYMNS